MVGRSMLHCATFESLLSGSLRQNVEAEDETIMQIYIYNKGVSVFTIYSGVGRSCPF